MMKALICFSFILLIVGKSFALEVDEKLTFRILSTSSSKKTVLMNRGLEDGLAVGDHAKFFLTTGVIARAVIVKASPSRSIWSIYRLIDEAQIVPDKVLNLKIATPVKVTEDSTKSLQEESTVEGDDNISVPAEDAEEMREKSHPGLNKTKKEEKDELEALEDETNGDSEKVKKKSESTSKPRSRISMTEHQMDDLKTFDKNFEIWGALGSLSLLSTTITVDGDSESYGGGTNSFDTSFGIEKYFADRDRWYYRFSLIGMGHMFNQTVQVSDKIRSSAKVFEYGGGITAHFVADPFAYDRVIGYTTFLFGVGSATSSTESDGTTEDRSGTCQFLSLGVGAKYYMHNGFGGRLGMDYYRRSESYDADEEGTLSAMNKTVGGVRVQLGLSYRF